MNNFKKEFNESDFKHVRKTILNHFNTKPVFDRFNKMVLKSRSFNELDNLLGLAYTSSSSFAMFSICNTEVYLDREKKFKYEHFGIDSNGFVFAVCQDSKENELYINI